MRLTKVTALLALVFLGCTELSRLHASPHPVFFAPPFRFKGGLSPLQGFFTSFWKLADTSDSIGSNTLTNVNGVTFSAGKIGNAANLVKASSKRLTVASNSGLVAAGSFTIAGWAKYTSGPQNQTILSKWTSGASPASDEWLLYSPDNVNMAFGISNGTVANDNVVHAPIPSLNVFHLYIAWLDTAAQLAYIQVDNNAPVSAAYTSTPASTTAVFAIGSLAGGLLPMDGQVDAVGWVKGKIPSAGQRAALWNGGTGTEYPF